MSKSKLAAIIVICTVAIIIAIVLSAVKPWEETPSADTYTLTTSVSPSGAGSISPSGGEYESGDRVTLAASPASGYTFDYWSGSASGTTSTLIITMDSDKSLTAHFETTPEVLFSDDFSDEAGVWDIYSDENGSVFYENGWLHLINHTTAIIDTSTDAHQHFTDFILEVETKLVGGTDSNWQSVECRSSDNYNYYYFGISGEGYYDILKYLNANMITLVGPTYSSYINQGVNAVNLIHIECIGSNLSLSVNGHLLEEVTDATFGGGDIALVATSLGGSFTEIAFDNIVVSDVDVSSDIVDELEAANGEAENVKTAALAYYADYEVWPPSSASLGAYLSGTLGASYSFDDDGFINGVGDPSGFGGGTTSYMYPGIHWENPTSGVGHGHWVVDY